MKLFNNELLWRYLTVAAVMLMLSLEFWAVALSWPSKADNWQGTTAGAGLPEGAPFLTPARSLDHAQMQASLIKKLGPRADEYAVYFLRPGQEQEPFLYMSKSMSPASMIKLFVMAAVMQAVHDGELSLYEMLPVKASEIVGGAGVLTFYDEDEKFTVRKLLELMIVESDNTATNILIERLGMGNIQSYITGHGYGRTQLRQKMMSESKVNKKNLQTNRSSVEDIGLLLTRIYRRECVGFWEDRLMRSVLEKQKDDECFPKALPDWQIAHKTGETSGTYADGGIFVKDGRQPFVLVIMCGDYSSRSTAVKDMRLIAALMADYAGAKE